MRNVSKRFHETVALNNVSLGITEGEVLALLGPNGSGKTTLLRILAFIQEPSEGEVCFQGVRVTRGKLECVRKESTMVFQRTVLFNTTVYNNVAYGLRVRSVPRDRVEEKVGKALRLVKLEGFEKRQAKQLSGGEQQRVALARALVLDTKLLLLDEPTANLDPKNSAIIEDIIARVNSERKTTIVIATHNMFQAQRLPSRIALIKEGGISEVGIPTEIFGRLSKALVSFTRADNTFAGIARIADDGTTTIDIGSNVQIIAASRGKGEVSLFVSPEDIIISKDCFESSARNVFKGKIVEVQDAGAVVRLRVDVGKIFTAQITKHSFIEMSLNMGTIVFLTFKASNVQIVR